MITKGTRVRFIVIGRCQTFLTTLAGDVRASVNERLSARGWTVFSSVVIAATNERLGDWDYRAELTVSSPVDHAAIEDMASVVRGAFWEEAGGYPTVSAPGYTTQGEQPSPTPILPQLGGGFGVTGFLLLALVLVTATGVFVFKRG